MDMAHDKLVIELGEVSAAIHRLKRAIVFEPRPHALTRQSALLFDANQARTQEQLVSLGRLKQRYDELCKILGVKPQSSAHATY